MVVTAGDYHWHRNELEAAIARQHRREMDEAAWGCTLIIAVPLFILLMVFRGLVAGVTGLTELLSWFATHSVLSPLFPAPGDSLLRGTLSIITLLIVIPGPVFFLASLLRGTRLALLRWALIPLGLGLTVVTPAFATYQLLAAVGRLPS